ncbi:uncharacterized protein V1510DRAFT_234979 [Dipodascopsis tothii]|uniref:uncharacterized protein n=1 Tax=Dipodascopsis tothii TaxID=44089 RepID=UPI0034CDA9D6
MSSVRKPFKTHYDALGLPPPPESDDVSPVEIKQAYHNSLLLYHPDKAQDLPDGYSSAELLDAVIAAYTVLSVPRTRRVYDQSLLLHTVGSATGSVAAFAAATENAETVDLDDLDHIEICTVHNSLDDYLRGIAAPDAACLADKHCNFIEVWSRSCRCGNIRGYVVTDELLEQLLDAQEEQGGRTDGGELLTQCTGCSSWIKIAFELSG